MGYRLFPRSGGNRLRLWSFAYDDSLWLIPYYWLMVSHVVLFTEQVVIHTIKLLLTYSKGDQLKTSLSLWKCLNQANPISMGALCSEWTPVPPVEKTNNNNNNKKKKNPAPFMSAGTKLPLYIKLLNSYNNPIKIQWKRYYYYVHFTFKKTEP